jgi:hypothetical protein
MNMGRSPIPALAACGAALIVAEAVGSALISRFKASWRATP